MAPAEKFGLGRKFEARTYAILSQIKIFWRFTHFLEIFGQKKCLLGSKTVFLGQKVHYYMVYIAYYTAFNLHICNYTQKARICHKNSKYALDLDFCGHFCACRKAANFCHPGLGKNGHFGSKWHIMGCRQLGQNERL